jgi:SAM-dependent methyltransferase
VAGDRLALLADVFGPSTEAFLLAAAPARPELALDLGCGPGHTTQLVAEVTGARRTVGLESSTAFVERGREGNRRADVELVAHDVTVVPFPARPADLVFARYLLAHLPAPAALVASWLGEVRRGGRLLVEEIVAIDAVHPALARYAEIVTALSAAHGTDLLVGGALGAAPGAVVVHDETVRITPDPATVARLFRMNLGVWRHDPWARDALSVAELDDLDASLAAVAADPPAPGAISWRHRQLGYERR